MKKLESEFLGRICYGFVKDEAGHLCIEFAEKCQQAHGDRAFFLPYFVGNENQREEQIIPDLDKIKNRNNYNIGFCQGKNYL